LLDCAIEDLAHLSKAQAFFLTEEAQDNLDMIFGELDESLVRWERWLLWLACRDGGLAE
jgi:hypothetical protein